MNGERFSSINLLDENAVNQTDYDSAIEGKINGCEYSEV